MNVKYNMVVDFARPNKTNTILVSENDNESRIVHFTLLSDKDPIDMSDVSYAMMRMVAANGAIITEDLRADIITEEREEDGETVEVFTNQIEYAIPGAVTAYSGTTTGTITLYSTSSQKEITSFEFYIKVRNALFNEDDEASIEDVNGFRELYKRVQEALQKLENNIKEDRLPNPNALRVEHDGFTYDYDGTDFINISFGNLAHISDEVINDELDAVEDFALQQVLSIADEINASSNYIRNIYNSSLEYLGRLDTIRDDVELVIPHIVATEENGVITVEITYLDGENLITNVGYLYDAPPEGGGSGGSGTTDYNELNENSLPTINGTILKGELDTESLGLVDPDTVEQIVEDKMPTITLSDVDGGVSITVADGVNDPQTKVIHDGGKGEPGKSGTTWYRGNKISNTDGTSRPYPTEIDHANVNDIYINLDGEIYHCTVEGDENTAEWVYDFTLSGGGTGGSGTSNYNDLANLPKIKNHELKGNMNAQLLELADAIHNHNHNQIEDWNEYVPEIAASWDENDDVKVITAKLVAEVLGSYALTEDLPDVSNAQVDIKVGTVVVGSFNLNGGAKTITIPAIPSVVDKYNASSTSAMSGKAVAEAISEKANAATTLSGYGITDAKIESGTIILGANTIKPLTEHQDISEKLTGHIIYSNNSKNTGSDSCTVSGTTYTFSSDKISADSLVDVYASAYGVVPDSIVVGSAGGTVTVTFESNYDCAVVIM